MDLPSKEFSPLSIISESLQRMVALPFIWLSVMLNQGHMYKVRMTEIDVPGCDLQKLHNQKSGLFALLVRTSFTTLGDL